LSTPGRLALDPEAGPSRSTTRPMPPGRRSHFGVAFAILPAPQRDAIRAVHAFSHAVDDSVDEERDQARARESVARWRQDLARLYDGGDPDERETLDLKPHVQRFGIPRGYLDELLSGIEMDLTHARYSTFQDLAGYCYRVASVVGLICLRIFGDEEERGRSYAENLGMALQLTNILRDVGSDHARGRIYLPAEDRERFGYSEEALARRERSEAFLDLMRFQAARARSFFAAADRETARLDRKRLVAAEIMGRVYRRLLERIEASGFDVFAREIRVPRLERVWIAASTAVAIRAAR
jgi:15-cis-phytoene synthase